VYQRVRILNSNRQLLNVSFKIKKGDILLYISSHLIICNIASTKPCNEKIDGELKNVYLIVLIYVYRDKIVSQLMTYNYNFGSILSYFFYHICY